MIYDFFSLEQTVTGEEQNGDYAILDSMKQWMKTRSLDNCRPVKGRVLNILVFNGVENS